MTAGKATTLPLLLPWGLICWPNLKRLATRPLLTAGLVVGCGFASLLTMCYFNVKYTGEWSGTKVESLNETLKPNGRILLSGLLTPQLGEVESLFSEVGFTREETQSNGEWSAAAYRRPGKAFQDRLATGGAEIRILRLRGANPIEGGDPIVADGKIVGAIGISGGSGEQDGVVARAGVAALK